MTIEAKMTANEIRAAVAADPSLKPDAVKVLSARFQRGTMKWRSLTTFAEYLGFTSEERATKQQLVDFVNTALKPKASKKSAKPQPQPKAEPQLALAFVEDFDERIKSLTNNELKLARMAIGTMQSADAAPHRRKGAMTILRKVGLAV